MRSRFSAFCIADGKYLHKSQHTTTRPKIKSERKDVIKWAKSVTWIGLEIISTTKGTVNDDLGTVEFKANYLENGEPSHIHEKSNFEKENGHWVYVDGINLQ